MPIYVYEHPKTGKTIEVIQSMKEDHSYKDKSGLKWNRVFSAPSASIDANIDPFSSKSFVDKTNAKGTVGDLLERSKELSNKRKDKLGYDPVQKKYFENYSEKRRGRKHNLDK
tara:strand:- start:22 stop:360 length:339 start_codon:yes stop_codon:yes gene_type:complete